MLVIASRPSTIALADDVVYLETGRIAGRGDHADLMASNDSYRSLVEAFEADRAVPTDTPSHDPASGVSESSDVPVAGGGS